MDVISVQHAKWIAKRLRRCLGFHNQALTSSQGEGISGQRLHDRSKQGTKGEFARLQRALTQQFPDPTPGSGGVKRGPPAKKSQTKKGGGSSVEKQCHAQEKIR